MLRIATVMKRLTSLLLNTALDVDCHSSLNPSQIAIIAKLNGVDAKLVAKWATIATKAIMVNIYIKRGGKIQDRTYHRAAITSFPVYDAIAEGRETNNIYGIKMRKAASDYNVLSRVLEVLLPDIETRNAYSDGSESPVAPTFAALAASYGNIATDLNGITELFKSVMTDEEYENTIINSKWIKEIENIESFRDALPILPGNDGGAHATSAASDALAPTAEIMPIAPQAPAVLAPQVLAPQVLAPQVAPPVQQPQYAPPVQQPQYAAPVQQPQYAAPVQQPQQPQYAAPVQQQQLNSDGKTEWNGVGGQRQQAYPVNHYGQPVPPPPPMPGSYANQPGYGQAAPVQQPIGSGYGHLPPPPPPMQPQMMHYPQQTYVAPTGALHGQPSPLL